ncbi:hypothetical protein ACFXJ8_01985 [Nonomuraea sp. NPDC059194]
MAIDAHVILPAGPLRRVTAGPDGYTATAPADAPAGTPGSPGKIVPTWIA